MRTRLLDRIGALITLVANFFTRGRLRHPPDEEPPARPETDDGSRTTLLRNLPPKKRAP